MLDARADVLARGITINGLPLMTQDAFSLRWGIPDLDAYYLNCVIGGTGAFVLPVLSWDQFADSVKRKLILEIAARPAPAPPFYKRYLSPPPPPPRCLPWLDMAPRSLSRELPMRRSSASTSLSRGRSVRLASSPSLAPSRATCQRRDMPRSSLRSSQMTSERRGTPRSGAPFIKSATERGVEDPVGAENRSKMFFFANNIMYSFSRSPLTLKLSKWCYIMIGPPKHTLIQVVNVYSKPVVRLGDQ